MLLFNNNEEPLWANIQNSVYQNWNTVGEMDVVHRETQNKVSLLVKKKQLNFDGSETYCAVFFDPLQEIEEVLGELTIYPVMMRKNNLYCEKINSENPLNFDVPMYHYGKTKKKVEKIWIDWIEAKGNDEYKGIGTSMIQVAIELSLNRRFKGRIMLSAEWQSHGFYLKTGFHAKNPEEEKEMRRHIEEKRENGAFVLHLPEETIKDRWEPVINQNPILEATKIRLDN